MPTKLTGSKRVVRETLTTIQGRNIIVTMNSHFIKLRPKGKKYSYDVPIEAVFIFAARKEAERKIKEKREARAAAKKVGKK